MPLVSVITAVFNGAPYLDAAIASIAGQSFRDFEYIVVDDGSTDATPEILARWRAADPRIRVIARENRGKVVSRNEAAAAASGRYLSIMDADDIALPEKLAVQVARLEAAPEIVALGTQVELIDAEDRPIRRSTQALEHEVLVDAHARVITAQLFHSSVVMRADAFRAVGGYREAFDDAEDYDLWLRLEEQGRIANCPEMLLRYRLHAASTSHTASVRQMRRGWQAAREAAERRGVPFAHPFPEIGRERGERPADLYRKWAWWALSGQNLATARLYARRALLTRPLDAANWRLAFCALRGR